MINTPDIERPPKQLIETLSSISSATAAGELCRLGIRDPQILGPIPRTPGKTVVGPALTLQFMPKREDIYAVDEYNDPEKQLHRHALYHTQPGDIIVVDARGDLSSDLLQRARRHRCNRRWVYPGLPLCADARDRVVAEGNDPQFPHANEYLPVCRQCSRRLRRHLGDARRYHCGR